MPSNPIHSLPDVASDAQTDAAGALDWVGMENIALPVRLAGADGATVQCAARLSAFVNLANAQARGIHMSRLYLHLDRALGAEALTPASLRRLLHDFLDSHAGLSDRAMLRIAFDHLLRRPALVSDNSGWKAYPVEISATLAQGHFMLELQVDVQYSSTCPASAALARQLIQNRFAADFARGKALDHAAVEHWLGSARGICATPHSQRSTAGVRVRLAPGFDLPIVELIDAIEDALATPVQTAVKREDEQAFARLNGENPMFCEDAARRIRGVLDADERIADFHIRAAHHESLHAHDAVAVATKGVAGGFPA
ncbi:MAG: GTP cyclohydrolase I FolE2 [Proteobacteria bacterium]|nr:GTP cyclohydrolase I FolE2 [Pseudomonadota bacterium]